MAAVVAVSVGAAAFLWRRFAERGGAPDNMSLRSEAAGLLVETVTGLREPLVVLCAEEEAIRRSSDTRTPVPLRTAGELGSALHQIRHVLTQVMDLAELAGGASPKRREPTDPCEVSRAVAKEINAALRCSGSAVKVSLSSTQSSMVFLDAQKYTECLKAILAFAVSSDTEEGPIRMRLHGEPSFDGGEKLSILVELPSLSATEVADLFRSEPCPRRLPLKVASILAAAMGGRLSSVILPHGTPALSLQITTERAAERPDLPDLLGEAA
ncbi:hypothetical protein [Parvularcula maris]|uniref:hypothetical protein n=1 Tax=Parvularcula maris TaxID=2965077 RepID=UPI002115200E|nr:hypothetical protein [Parvularcula maris]